MKKNLINIAKALVAGVILTYLVRSGKLDFSQIPQALHNWPWLVLAFVVLASEVLLCGFRWQLLLRGVGVREEFWPLLHFTWIGALFNSVMMGSVGGDVIKIMYVVRHFPDKKVVTGMTVFLDRVLGLYAMILLVAVSFLFASPTLVANPALHVLRLVIWSIVVGSWIALPILFSPRWKKWLPNVRVLHELVTAVQGYRHAKRTVLAALGVAFVGHLGLILVTYSLIRALGGPTDILSFGVVAMIAPVGIMTLAIPISPGGLGVGQAAFSKLFQWVGVTSLALGANTMTILQVLQVLANSLGFFSYLTYRHQDGKRESTPRNSPSVLRDVEASGFQA